MRRLLGLAIGLALAPQVASAQSVVSFGLGSDSVLAVLTGATRSVQLQVNGTGGVSAYNITVFFDASQVTVSAVDTAPGGYGLPIPTIDSTYTDSVILSASGTGSTAYTVPIANITFSMGAGATQGSLISLRVNSLTLGDQVTDALPGHRTGILDVCQATRMLGDVTGDRVVNSRDALVVLTAAVGLPATGFDLAAGDADADGQVTSRDALLILGDGIGISTGFPDLGWGIPNVCAPLTVAPDSLLFFRSTNLYEVAKGDSMPTLLPLALAPQTTYYPARWSPDGSHVLYTAYTGTYYYDVVDADSTGAVVDTLTRNTYWDGGADWSPDGSRIAFVTARTSPNSVWLMNADGTNQTQLTTGVTAYLYAPVAWSPDGTQIAFVGCQTCTYQGVYVWNVGTGGLTQVVPESVAQNPRQLEWTAGSDSIYYAAGNQGYVRVAAAVAGDTGQVAVRLNGSAYYPTLSQAGRGFQSSIHSPYDFFLRRAIDGRYLRLVRGDASNSDQFFAFRRTGGVYVNSVSLSAPPITLAIAGTAADTATVTNNDASTNSTAPLTWTSRDPSIATVVSGGLRFGNIQGVAAGSTYVVVTVAGWYRDSVLVTVQ